MLKLFVFLSLFATSGISNFSIVEKKNNWFLHIVAYCGCLVKDGFKLYNCKTKSSSFFEMESFEKYKEQCESKVAFIVCQGFI